MLRKNSPTALIPIGMVLSHISSKDKVCIAKLTPGSFWRGLEYILFTEEGKDRVS